MCGCQDNLWSKSITDVGVVQLLLVECLKEEKVLWYCIEKHNNIFIALVFDIDFLSIDSKYSW